MPVIIVPGEINLNEKRDTNKEVELVKKVLEKGEITSFDEAQKVLRAIDKLDNKEKKVEAEKLILNFFKKFIEDTKNSKDPNKVKLRAIIKEYISEYEKATERENKEIEDLIDDIKKALQSADE